MKLKRMAVLYFLLAGCKGICFSPIIIAQDASAAYPDRLPYAFSNFVWWSDAELRTDLAKKLPGLADEIPPTVAAETRISHALTSLLRERGIVAEVQVQDPSQFAFTAQRVPEAPAPAIVFRILSPEIVVDKVMISGAPDQLADKLQDGLHGREGREYSSRQDWQLKMTVGQLLETNGYLDST
ncbi:MAG TPA: hypothetical protein VN678_13085, partial [Acidobacteriaceae bacterium]|nr:hypothetical protein [Acidobacteriaceae bacterium]